MSRYTLIALTNAAPGRDAEYNEWFDRRHIPEVLAVPGFKSVERFEAAHAQRVPDALPYRYAAVYTLESEDLPKTLDALADAIRAGTKTNASDPTRRAIWVYTPRGALRHK
jgi:hypothetical protein